MVHRGNKSLRCKGHRAHKLRDNLATAMRQMLLQRHNMYVSLWGMRALQGTFNRLKYRLPSDKLKRKYIIGSIVLPHNFRTHNVGSNQIATIFKPLYDQYINIDNYDRISRYYDNY